MWEKVESENNSSKQAMDKDEELARAVAESLRDAKFSRSTVVSGDSLASRRTLSDIGISCFPCIVI